MVKKTLAEKLTNSPSELGFFKGQPGTNFLTNLFGIFGSIYMSRITKKNSPTQNLGEFFLERVFYGGFNPQKGPNKAKIHTKKLPFAPTPLKKM